MSGDHSRDSFDALRDYAGVFLQQGRPVLDADWNELVRVFERRIRTATVDTIGRAVVPRETPRAFHLRAVPGGGLEIGRGRFYLHGLLVECHGAADFPSAPNDAHPDPVFDRGRQGASGPEGVLDELISPEEGDYVSYDAQPYWPTPAPLPEGDGPHLAYLVAWQREVTPIEQPELLEPALGGIDTTTRWQTVGQVRVLPDVGAEATCATPEDLLEGWVETSAPSTARLTTATIEIEDPEDPCLVPPTDGYTGLENQLYRVELHTVGASQGAARFKFSRENASVAAAIERVSSGGDRVVVRRVGRDDMLRIRAGDWVEITDDRRELDHRSGQMLRVASVDEETREIELDGTIDADLVPSGTDGDTAAARHSRMIRWDQRGVVRLSDGTAWVDLDDPAAGGLIPVPSDDRAIVLESGITVSFTTAPGAGGFREMDHWRFAARTAGTQVEALAAVPPYGVQRHYARLAVVSFPESLQDCRVFWPPEFEGGTSESCGCTVCVTPAGHNSGQRTIQAAIDQVGAEGGTVCLAGGTYELREPVRISDRRAVTVRGHGMGTVLSYHGAGSAIRVTSSIDVQIERLTVRVQAPDEDTGERGSVAGIGAANTVFLALRRLAVLVLAGGPERQDLGIAIDGVALGVKIEECVSIAPVALGSQSSLDTEDGPHYLALAELRVLDNVFFGTQAAVRFEGACLNLAEAVFARNLAFGSEAGFRVNWLEVPTAATEIAESTVLSNGDGLRLSTADLRVRDNDISGGAEAGNGIRLVDGMVREVEGDAQIIGNRIGDLAGAGIRIETRLGALIIKRNAIRSCGEAGVLTDPTSDVRHAAIENNVIERIAEEGGEAAAVGIMLARAERGQIAGNSVDRVGAGGSPDAIYAGVGAQAVGMLSIHDNVVGRVGPSSSANPAAGILVVSPFIGVIVRGNRILGAAEPTDDQGRGWIAIQIGRAGLELGERSRVGRLAWTAPGTNRDDVAYAEADGRTYALHRAGVKEVGRAGPSQITIGANLVRHAGRVGLPMLLVADPNDSSVILGENQIEQPEGRGGGPPRVVCFAPRLVASNNVVRHDFDAQSMLLSLGENGVSTVMGNITSGEIVVEPGGLHPPFDALNVRG